MFEQIYTYFRPTFATKKVIKGIAREIEETLGQAKATVTSVRLDNTKIMVRVRTVNGPEQFLFRV